MTGKRQSGRLFLFGSVRGANSGFNIRLGLKAVSHVCHTLRIPALGSLRQKVLEFKTSPHYISRHWLTNKDISIPIPPPLVGNPFMWNCVCSTEVSVRHLPFTEGRGLPWPLVRQQIHLESDHGLVLFPRKKAECHTLVL